MAQKLESTELHVVLKFLNACDDAAEPPPRLRENPLATPGPLGLLGPPGRSWPVEGILGKQFPRTLADVLGSPPPFVAIEELGQLRTDRIAVLDVWLHRFPIITSMKRRPAIRGAVDSFLRVQKRRSKDRNFSNDLAQFKFWRCATLAVIFLDSEHKPPPNAEQRARGVRTAKVLRHLADASRLLRAAGLDWQDEQRFRTALAKVEALQDIQRRERIDAYSADREYVRLLTRIFWSEFKETPPAIIAQLAALKLRNPDQTQVIKLVTATRRALQTLEMNK